PKMPAEQLSNQNDQDVPTETKVTYRNISLSSYPVSSELQNAFDKSNKRNLNSILMLEKAAQYGILAHEIMSDITSEQEIVERIDNYIESGILMAEERPLILLECSKI